MARINAQPRGALQGQVIDAMTTNETLWFRDTYPFRSDEEQGVARVIG